MKKFSILVVDDNENNRFTAKSILSGLDVVLYEANDGKEALACLLREEIHLILLDIQLPDYNGFEIAKIIKSKKSTMAIPIIFATAIYKTEEFIEEGYEIGAIDYIMKPINMNILLNKVKYYISVHNERNKLIHSLTEKNEEITRNYNELKLMENKIKQSETNWRILGENIPYLVEVYDEDMSLIFDNHINIKEQLSLVRTINSREYIEQIHHTLSKKERIIEVFTIEQNDSVYHFQVKSFVFMIDGKEHCMVIVSDVTIQQEYEQSIIQMGLHDQLTGLHNRHFIREYTENMDKRETLPLSIIMGDVNGLKMINDSLGHLAGDKLIKKASQVINEAISGHGVLARWGGDEFIGILPNTGDKEILNIIKEVRNGASKVMINNRFPLSIALGDATREEESFSFEEIIKEAEDKMYVNKMQSQSSYRSTVIDSLKNAMYERFYETEDHTKRMTDMALILADVMELNESDRDQLILLGDLHDIGKIAIPIGILNKTERLSDLDWNSIKRHPEIGFRICSAVPELVSVADLVLSHHEKWDGSGYPRGLKGKDIPVLARLISILDSFDVITHERPYKEAKSVSWALGEITRCSGSQFDPDLVDLFIKTYESKGFIEILM